MEKEGSCFLDADAKSIEMGRREKTREAGRPRGRGPFIKLLAGPSWETGDWSQEAYSPDCEAARHCDAPKRAVGAM